MIHFHHHDFSPREPTEEKIELANLRHSGRNPLPLTDITYNKAVTVGLRGRSERCFYLSHSSANNLRCSGNPRKKGRMLTNRRVVFDREAVESTRYTTPRENPYPCSTLPAQLFGVLRSCSRCREKDE